MKQVLLLYVRVNLGVIAMKGYSTFPKLQDWSLTIRCSLLSYSRHLLGGGRSAEVQLAYSTAPADRARIKTGKLKKKLTLINAKVSNNLLAHFYSYKFPSIIIQA